MPKFSGLNTRYGSYDVIIPDSFTENRVNRVLEIVREYYSKLDGVLNTINSHLHFSGVRGRFSYKGEVVADLDASGNLKIFATTKIYYGGVEITLRKNVLGTRNEIIIEEIDEPREVLLALNYLLKGMRVTEQDVLAITSSLLAVATLSEGLGQSFRPTLFITTQRAGKILGGEFTASFKLSCCGDVVLQKSDFSGEHIETARDYYLKALTVITAYLLEKGKLSTEAFYALLSYYGDNRRFTSTFYLRGLASSTDVVKAKSRYKWVDTAYEVIGNSIQLPVKKVISVKWPKVERIEAETPISAPEKPQPPKVVRKKTTQTGRPAKPKSVERPVEHAGSAVKKAVPVVAGATLLMASDELEKEILGEKPAPQRPKSPEVRRSEQRKPVPVKEKRIAVGEERKRGVSPEKEKRPAERQGEKLRPEVKKSEDRKEPVVMDNWSIGKRVATANVKPVDPAKELLPVVRKLPKSVDEVPSWLSEIRKKCDPMTRFTTALCDGFEGITSEFPKVDDNNVVAFSNRLSELVLKLGELAKTPEERAIVSAIKYARSLVKRRADKVVREMRRKVELEERLKGEFLREVANFLDYAVRVIGETYSQKPGVKPLSKLLKRVKLSARKLKENGIDYSEVVSALEEFVDILAEVLKSYPSVSPREYNSIPVISPEVEEELNAFAEKLRELSKPVEKLKGTEFEKRADKLLNVINKVAERFAFSKGKVRSKVKAYVNKELLAVYTLMSREKIIPPVLASVKNAGAIKLADELEKRLNNVAEVVRKSRIKDKDALLKKVETAEADVRNFREFVERINALPTLTSKERALEGLKLAGELLKSVPNSFAFKNVRRAIRKYIKLAEEKAGTRAEVRKVELDKIMVSKPYDKCAECPELITLLEEELKVVRDRGKKERILATIKALKLFDEYPLAVVHSIRNSPDKFSRFRSRVLGVMKVVDKLPPAVREVFEKNYATLVETKAEKKNKLVSLRTKVQSVSVPFPAKRLNYEDVKVKIEETRREVVEAQKSGEINEETARDLIARLDETMKVVSLFEKYPLSDIRPDDDKVIEEVKQVNTSLLPVRVARAFESYKKAISGKENKGSRVNYYMRAMKHVKHLRPEDVVNLRYDRVNGVLKSISKYAHHSEKVSKLYADLEVLSKVLQEASEKGVRKLITITPVINTNKIIVERLKSSESISDERLASVYRKLENARNDLIILKKTISSVKSVVGEKEVLELLNGAEKIVDDAVNTVETLEEEVERIAKEKGKKIQKPEEATQEEGRPSRVSRILSSILSSILSIITPEEEKMPDNVENYPKYIEEKLKEIDPVKVFRDLLDVSQTLGRVRVMASKYREETGKDVPQKAKIEALTRFALTVSDLRDEVEYTPAEITSLSKHLAGVVSIAPAKLRVIFGGGNLSKLLEIAETAIGDAEKIISEMEKVEVFGKDIGYDPVPASEVKSLRNALASLKKSKSHIEKAIETDFSTVNLNYGLDFKLKAVVKLPVSKVRKDVKKAEKVATKEGEKREKGLKIDYDEALPEIIKDTAVASKIGAGNSVSKLKFLLKAVVSNTRAHNKTVEKAVSEFKEKGFFTEGTLRTIRSTAMSVKSSCEVFIRSSEAVSKEIEEKAKEYAKKEREKRVSEKLKGKKEPGVLDVMVAKITAGGEEVHVDSLLDEIATAREEVEKILSEAERVISKVDSMLKKESMPGDGVKAEKVKGEKLPTKKREEKRSGSSSRSRSSSDEYERLFKALLRPDKSSRRRP